MGSSRFKKKKIKNVTNSMAEEVVVDLNEVDLDSVDDLSLIIEEEFEQEVQIVPTQD